MDAKELVIVDASVIIKWIVDEADSDGSKSILKQYNDGEIELGIVSHTFAEVLNILGLKKNELASEFFSYLLMLEMKEFKIEMEAIALALNIMKKYQGVSFYDALYHGTALKFGGTFVTADKKYFEKVWKEGAIRLV